MNNLKNIIKELKSEENYPTNEEMYSWGIRYAIDMLECWQKELKERYDMLHNTPYSSLPGEAYAIKEVLGE